MFDTHCHLNFKAFDGRIEQVRNDARKAGVTKILIPGTDIETSQKAIAIAEKYDNVYAAVGIHPHHVYNKFKSQSSNVKTEIQEIEKLLVNPKVVAVGEVGVDRHYYSKTKYPNYQIDDSFMLLQREFLSKQIDLALRYEKSLILHNREARSPSLRSGVSGRAKKDFLEVLEERWDEKLKGKTVFHCCEPDQKLLEYAKRHKVYIGVDGDVTYREDKQEFIKKVPLDMLVLETDSPFLHPEPLRSQPRNIRGANEPKNLVLIASFIARKIGLSLNKLIKMTEENSLKLFKLSHNG